MAFNYNGNAVSNLNWNGNPVTTLNFNGVQVWTYTPPVEPYFWIEPESNGNVTYVRKRQSSYTSGVTNKTVKYSFDKTNWTNMVQNTGIAVNAGQKIFIKGENTTAFYNSNTVGYNTYYINTGFHCDQPYKVGGPLSSLFNDANSFFSYYMQYVFSQETNLKDASLLIFPTELLSGASYTFYNLFDGCTSLIGIPNLPILTLRSNCYHSMFYGCTALKFSETQTAECPNAYRIPTTGTGTTVSGALNSMFAGTSGTFTGTPTINTTYYTNATVIS